MQVHRWRKDGLLKLVRF